MNQKKKPIARFVPLLIALAVLIASFAFYASARYIRFSNELVNAFSPADSINPTVREEFDGVEKKNVKIYVGDTDYPVYVRVKIVITWQDSQGINYYVPPVEGVDYEIDINDTDWIFDEDDGFYYYTKKVPSGKETEVLIKSCKEKLPVPFEGYTLSVNIIVQTVQAVGYTDGENNEPIVDAFKDAWNLKDD